MFRIYNWFTNLFKWKIQAMCKLLFKAVKGAFYVIFKIFFFLSGCYIAIVTMCSSRDFFFVSVPLSLCSMDGTGGKRNGKGSIEAKNDTVITITNK